MLFVDQTDVGVLISGSSAFSKSSLNIWKIMVHILLKPGLENFEHCFTCMGDKCNMCLSQCVCLSHSVCSNILLCVCLSQCVLCLSLYVCVSLSMYVSLSSCEGVFLSVCVFLCASVYVSLMWLYVSHSQGLCPLVSQNVCLHVCVTF